VLPKSNCPLTPSLSPNGGEGGPAVAGSGEGVRFTKRGEVAAAILAAVEGARPAARIGR